MKIGKMIEQLQSIAEKYPESEVKMHLHRGNSSAFSLCLLIRGKPIMLPILFIDKISMDPKNDILVQIDDTKCCNIKDVLLLQNLLAIGFTWKYLEDWLDKKDYDYFVEVGKAFDLLE